MGLKETMQNAAKTVVKAVGNIAEDISYIKLGTTDYDTFTGVVGTQNEVYTTTAIFLEYTDDEIDGTTVQKNDRKVLIAASDLTVIPEIDDQIKRSLEIYSIVNLETDPAKAAWILQVRKP